MAGQDYGRFRADLVKFLPMGTGSASHPAVGLESLRGAEAT